MGYQEKGIKLWPLICEVWGDQLGSLLLLVLKKLRMWLLFVNGLVNIFLSTRLLCGFFCRLFFFSCTFLGVS